MFENIRIWEKFMNTDTQVRFFVDTELFTVEVIMKTLFLFLDSCYVFLKKEADGVYVQLVKKGGCKIPLEELMGNISNELLNTLLMEHTTKDNQKMREEIITRALWYSLCEAAVHEEADDVHVSEDIDSLLKELDNEFKTLKS